MRWYAADDPLITAWVATFVIFSAGTFATDEGHMSWIAGGVLALGWGAAPTVLFLVASFKFLLFPDNMRFDYVPPPKLGFIAGWVATAGASVALLGMIVIALTGGAWARAGVESLFRFSYWLEIGALLYLIIVVRITMTPLREPAPPPMPSVSCVACGNRFPAPGALHGHTVRCVVCGVEQRARNISTPGGSP